MKKLSEEKIREIKALRRRGLTHREIAKKLNIAHMTAYYYTLDTKITTASEVLEEFNKLLQKNLIDNRYFEIFTSPDTIICSHCTKQNKKIGFCWESGTFFCMDCGNHINLRTAQRKEELAIK